MMNMDELRSSVTESFGLIFEATFARDSADYAYKRQIADQVKKMLSDGHYEKLDDGTYLIRGTDLDDSFSDLMILFSADLNKDTAFGDGHKVGYAYGHTNKYKVIICSCLIEPGNHKYIDTRFDVTKFIHEFTHYIDESRSSDKFSGSSDKTTKHDYFNHPHEFNAYYMENAMFILNAMRSNEMLREHLAKKIKTYDDFQKLILNSLDKEFVNSLNDTYRTKLLKRIYTLYPEFLRILKKDAGSPTSLSGDNEFKF